VRIEIIVGVELEQSVEAPRKRVKTAAFEADGNFFKKFTERGNLR
jgi:hypothetical protein